MNIRTSPRRSSKVRRVSGSSSSGLNWSSNEAIASKFAVQRSAQLSMADRGLLRRNRSAKGNRFSHDVPTEARAKKCTWSVKTECGMLPSADLQTPHPEKIPASVPN